jgi:hypothetical protein
MLSTYLSTLTANMTCELLQCDDINNVEPSNSQGWAITLPTYRPGKPSGSGSFTTGTCQTLFASAFKPASKFLQEDEGQRKTG